MTIRDIYELSLFTSGSWWTRLWPLQETALGRNVIFHCGNAQVTLLEVTNFYNDLYRVLPFKMQELSHLASEESDERFKWRQSCSRLQCMIETNLFARNAASMSEEDRAYSMVRILHFGREYRITDPRDRIYGLLGLCSAIFDDNIMIPDYTAEPRQVYPDFARGFIQKSVSLMLLNQASPIHNSLNNLPSWVPDWSSYYVHIPEINRFVDWNRYNACNGTPLHLLDGLSHLLGLRAAVLTTVKIVGEICEDMSSSVPARVTSAWRGLYKGLSEGSQSQERGSPFAFSEVRFAHTMMRSTSKTLSTDVVDDLHNALSSFESRDVLASRQILSKHGANLKDAITYTRFFVTADGCPALGPPDTTPGDTIAVLGGGKVPYVLRRQGGSESPANHYSLVGECYVQGVMQGEALRRADAPKLEDIWLE